MEELHVLSYVSRNFPLQFARGHLPSFFILSLLVYSFKAQTASSVSQNAFPHVWANILPFVVVPVHSKIRALPSAATSFPCRHCHSMFSLRVGRQSATQFNHSIYFLLESIFPVDSMEQRDNFLITMTNKRKTELHHLSGLLSNMKS